MICPRRRPAMLLGLTLLAIGLVLGGCQKKEKTQQQPGPGPEGPPPEFPPMVQKPLEETEPHAAGKKVFNANGCMRCHTIGGGQPVPPKGLPPLPDKGPDLAKVAAKADRNVEWFIAFVSNPKKFNPKTPMPPFEKQIDPKDMRALAEFLAGLK